MFTGLIEEIGKVLSVKRTSLGGFIEVKTSLKEVSVGDSIAVNGACLTVVETRGNSLLFEVSPETFEKTNLCLLKRGDPVNLERALRANSTMGGHFLLGHVDFTSSVISIRGSIHKELVLEIPSSYLIYFVEKGSVAIDGISLTVNRVIENRIYINIIPHTFEKTNLKYRKPGDKVNVETDIIGKYVIRYLSRNSLEKKLKDFMEK